MIVYNCECEKCKKITKVEVDENKKDDVFITCYGYLNVKCSHCGADAFAKWFGFVGIEFS